jgi:hypothetical protein
MGRICALYGLPSDFGDCKKKAPDLRESGCYRRVLPGPEGARGEGDPAVIFLAAASSAHCELLHCAGRRFLLW